ncbi:MAG TPA: hypothetical protein VH763_06280 [Gemmatimonadales bacterium]
MFRTFSVVALSGAVFMAGCGDGGVGPTTPSVLDCSAVTPTVLSVGQSAVLDAQDTACVRLPNAGPDGAEYLYVAVGTAARENTEGVQAPYDLSASLPESTAAATTSVTSPLLGAFQSPSTAREFHQRLRAMEQDLSEDPQAMLFNGPSAAVVAQAEPTLGEQRSFNVLRSNRVTGKLLSDYVQVTGTAKYVGTHAAIYLDNEAPRPTYSQDDIDHIGRMFDRYLYPADVAAFGAESDVNSDGVVLVLLSDRVTKLAGCSGSEIIIGFFFARDLIANVAGSNNAEIFYGLTPDPDCSISSQEATRLLPRVLIHEFQHMISYNQHVLLRRGKAEQTWLNEGLSTFAEEIGGRTVPDSLCADNDCLSQFVFDDFDNAYSYLLNVEQNFLIGPNTPPIPLTEYGAAWLFVRWLADHFAQTPDLGTDLTRKLDGTSLRGGDNVGAATGVPFPTLVGEWQLANYLDDLPGFTPANPRLQYVSWNLRQVYGGLNQTNPGTFPLSYPLVPDSTSGASYARSGSLRAGSGRHLLVVQPPSAGTVDLRLLDTDGTSAVADSIQPRVGLARIR